MYSATLASLESPLTRPLPFPMSAAEISFLEIHLRRAGENERLSGGTKKASQRQDFFSRRHSCERCGRPGSQSPPAEANSPTQLALGGGLVAKDRQAEGKQGI
jgi:hypothetical protein